MTSSISATILIVEDDSVVRSALANLSRDSGHRVAGAFSTAEEAWQFLQTEPLPEIILMDLNLPGMSGLEAIKRIKNRFRSANIAVITIFEDDKHVFEALKAGACGYLLKSDESSRIVDSLLELAAGGAPMTPRIARRVVGAFHPHQNSACVGPLSRRESEILTALSLGQTYHAIAIQFNISLHTVQNHIKSIYTKLQAHSRTEALNYARALNLLPPK